MHLVILVLKGKKIIKSTPITYFFIFPKALILAMYSNRDNIGELFVLHGVLKSTLHRFSVFAIHRPILL